MRTLSPAQRWHLALGAVLTELNEGEHDLLGSMPRPGDSEVAAGVLRDAWGLETRAEVTDALETLLTTGQRTRFEAEGHGTARDFLAWDLGRAASVAGWAYAAYLFDEAEAWRWLRRVAAIAQPAFGSWAEYGASYAKGRGIFLAQSASADAQQEDGDEDDDDEAEDAGGDEDEEEGEDDDPTTEQLIERLLTDPTAPWASLPWALDLSGATEPPIPQRRVRIVDRRGRGDVKSLEEALASAEPGDRLVLRAGRYRASIAPTMPIELVADGQVTITSEAGPVLRIDEVGVRLVGLSLRGEDGGSDDAPIATVVAESGFLRAEDCDVSGARFGIDLWYDAAEVHLARTRVRGTGSVGVVASGGFLVVEEGAIEAAGDAGAQIAGRAEATFERVRIAKSASNGLRVSERATVHVEGGDLSKTGHAAIQVDARARLTVADTRFHGGASGLLVEGQAQADLSGCTFEAHALAHVEVRGGRAALVSCTVRGGEECGLWCHGAGRLVFVDGRIEGTRRAGAHVGKGGDLRLLRAHLEGSREGGGVFVEGGAAEIDACTLEQNALAGIEVMGGAAPVVRDVRIVRCREGLFLHERARGRYGRVLVEAAAGAAVRVAEKADVLIEDLRVDGAKEAAIYVRDARATLLDPIVERAGLSSIELAKKGVARVEGGRLRDPGQVGVQVTKGSEIALVDVEIAGGDGGVRCDGGRATLTRCRVLRSTGSGVFAQMKAQVALEACEIAHHANAALEVTGTEVSAIDCALHDAADDDVFAYEGGRVVLVRGAVAGGKGHAFVAQEGGRIRAAGTRIDAGEKGESEVDRASKLDLDGCPRGVGARGWAPPGATPAPALVVADANGFALRLDPSVAACVSELRGVTDPFAAERVARTMLLRHAPDALSLVRFAREPDALVVRASTRAPLDVIAAPLARALSHGPTVRAALDDA
jgi:hypothetical protein